MADWFSQVSLPDGRDFLAQTGGAGQTSTGSQAPTPSVEPAGEGLNPWVIALGIVVFVVLLVVAIRSFSASGNKAAAADPDKPRKAEGASADADGIRYREKVDKLEEFSDDDSIAERKRKAAQKQRDPISYDEARNLLQARKAGQVTADQRRRAAESHDEAAPEDQDSPEPEASSPEAPSADEPVAEAASPEKPAAEAPSEAPAAEAPAPEPAQATKAPEETPAAEAPALPALVSDVPSLVSGLEDVDSGWGDIDLGTLATSADQSLSDPAVPSLAEAPKAPAVAEPARPAEQAVAEPAKPVEPVKPAEPVKPVEAAKPAEKPKAAEPAKPVEKPKAAPAVTRDVEAERAASKSLEEGLQKTRGGFVSRLGSLFKGSKKLDDNVLDEIEELLYTSDLGPYTVQAILKRVRKEVAANEGAEPAEVWGYVRQLTEELLVANERPLVIDAAKKPFVILVVGVNGVGKTTTIGKLATRYRDDGHKVLLVAGDTFRAAAIDQLAEWGQRTSMEVHTGGEGADPASVVFDGIKRGVDEGYDVVICDTAGRLTNKKNLMKELEKINRVAGKAQVDAPHETLLVLDANTGLMAVQQARMFQEVVDITGIVLTKLDGTAKGGVVIGISQELKVPVQFIGIGEGVYDLREFNARDFVEAMFL